MLFSEREYFTALRHDLVAFAELAFYEFHPEAKLLMNWHMELMAAKLEAFRRGLIKRLIINVPPRHWKSHLATVVFPAWCLGHNAALKIACACYGQDLSEDFARQSRALMQTPWYQRTFPTRLSDRQAVHQFETTRGGMRLATSVGGTFTGRGADFIIIDDATKTEDALSAPRRGSTNMWLDNTVLSRLNDKVNGGIAIIMQRQHQDDLVGHVLEQGHWDVLALPAIAIADETHVIESAFGSRRHTRRAGEVLHLEREPLEKLQEIRRNMGEFTFSAQYQQMPIPLEGAIVKTEWLKYYRPGEEPARFDRIVQSWDTANKAEEFNDYSVCTTWGVADKCFYLLHVYRAKLEFPALKRAVLELAGRYSQPTVVIEDKASGQQLIQDLRLELFGIQPYEPPKGLDKEVRLRLQTPIFEQGLVLLPESAPWLPDYVAELTGFPGTRYDDQVDSTTQALAYMRESDSLAVWTKLGEGADDGLLRRYFSGPIIPWFGPRF